MKRRPCGGNIGVISVQRISQQWMSDCCHMDADLVGPPGLNTAQNQ